MKRNNKGFTLIELIVATAIGTLVMAAATTVILLGIRVNNQANETAKNQFTTRTLMTLLEDLSSEGKITKVTSSTGGWVILVKGEGAADRVALYYNAEEQTIFTGGEIVENNPVTGGTAIMKGVYASYVTMADKLLTFSMETEQGTFASTLNCRTANEWTTGNVTDATVPRNPDVTDKRKDFLDFLSMQYTTNPVNKGQIVSAAENDADKGKYYAQWYIENTQPDSQPPAWNDGTSGWDANTPWCVCFISWGLYKAGLMGGHRNFWYADVDEFMADLQKGTAGIWTDREVAEVVTKPTPGDLVFFDWIPNGVSDPQHIGAVLKVEGTGDDDPDNDFIYTIEGNSAGVVAVRKYPLNDERIIGYGILNWG